MYFWYNRPVVFKKRYEIIDYYNCKSLDIKEGVTTMGDECNPVG